MIVFDVGKLTSWRLILYGTKTDPLQGTSTTRGKNGRHIVLVGREAANNLDSLPDETSN